jgi:hypothetical protein
MSQADDREPTDEPPARPLAVGTISWIDENKGKLRLDHAADQMTDRHRFGRAILPLIVVAFAHCLLALLIHTAPVASELQIDDSDFVDKTPHIPEHYSQDGWTNPSLHVFGDTGGSSKSAQDRSAALIDQRIREYGQALGSLEQVFYLHLALFAVTLVVLRSRSKLEDLVIYGLSFRGSMIHMFLIAAFTYLWVRFGMAMNRAVTERKVLWKLLDNTEGSTVSARRSLHSMRPLLEDRGVLDCWFWWYQPSYHLHQDSSWSLGFVGIVGIGILGLGCALAHAFSFMLAVDMHKKHMPRNRKGTTFLWMIIVALILFYAGCSWAFHTAGNHQGFVVLDGFFTLAVLLGCSSWWLAAEGKHD